LETLECSKKNNPRRRANYEKHFGQPAVPFVQMLDDLSGEKTNLPYKLYFDNLFMGINLLKDLKGRSYGDTEEYEKIVYQTLLQRKTEKLVKKMFKG
ncbi:hypothetical protein ILUMI_15146, partial [Ignelater luminosus]